jgi:hypothetical protein
MTTDKLVSAGQSSDLVLPTPQDIIIDYIKSNWDNNFDWDNVVTPKPMPDVALIKFSQWWSGVGPMSIQSSLTYCKVENATVGQFMTQTDSVITLDIFARQIKYGYPLMLSTVIRFIRQLITLNPRGLSNKGISWMRITRMVEPPEQDPRSSIYHVKIDITLTYFHQKITV